MSHFRNLQITRSYASAQRPHRSGPTSVALSSSITQRWAPVQILMDITQLQKTTSATIQHRCGMRVKAGEAIHRVCALHVSPRVAAGAQW